MIRPSQSKHIERGLGDDVCIGRHRGSVIGIGEGTKSGRSNNLISFRSILSGVDPQTC